MHLLPPSQVLTPITLSTAPLHAHAVGRHNWLMAASSGRGAARPLLIAVGLCFIWLERNNMAFDRVSAPLETITDRSRAKMNLWRRARTGGHVGE